MLIEQSVMRQDLLSVLFMLGILGTMQAQEPATLIYDVSTVRPHNPLDPSMRWGAPNGHYEAINVTLKALIADAWGVREDQVSGEPKWVDEDAWDVTGKAVDIDEAGLRALSKEVKASMAQTLLADRFHVKVHLDSRTAPVLQLIVSKGGLKMKEVAPPAPSGRLGEAKIPSGGYFVSNDDGAASMTAHAIGITALSQMIAGNLRQTVIDQTGLSPDLRFDFKLRWNSDTGMGGAAVSDAPPLSSAIEEQLGLHLNATRGPAAIVDIDHVDRPSDN